MDRSNHCTKNDSDHIKEFVNSNASFLNEDQRLERSNLLSEIERILIKWIFDECGQFDNGSRVYSFGSYPLNTSMQDSDMDLVCVIPNCITRRDFFEIFPQMIREEMTISNLLVVAATRVPLIKFTKGVINVDLILCIVPLDVIPENADFDDMTILSSMDDVSLHSITGYREINYITKSALDRDKFTIFIRFIKCWCKKHKLSNANMCFLPSMAWIYLALYVYLQSPLDDLIDIIDSFFKIFSVWNWPSAVILQNAKSKSPASPFSWNMNHLRECAHKMPIVRPIYPEENIAGCITLSTLLIIKSKFVNASSQMDSIISGEDSLDKLLVADSFAQMYKHYILVKTSAKCYNGCLEWSGLIESKLKYFVRDLEKEAAIEIIHPYPRRLSSKEFGSHVSFWIIGLKITKTNASSLDLSIQVDYFHECVEGWMNEANINRKGLTMSLLHSKQKRLRDYLPEDILLSL